MTTGRAFARGGLVGNPSDGYGGRTISVIVRNFAATVTLTPAAALRFPCDAADIHTGTTLEDFRSSVRRHGYYGYTRLLKAALVVFLDYCAKHDRKPGPGFFSTVCSSAIPRQVGLAGSSAVVIAMLRALAAFYGIDPGREMLPGLALQAERDELGITAGFQDRVIQTYEGCVLMDFSTDEPRYVSRDTALLPPLYIAYHEAHSKVSGQVLNAIGSKYAAGDREVIHTLQRIADLVLQADAALLSGDHAALHAIINENFDLRSRIMPIREADARLIKTARSCGASAKFAGSGGSVIGTYADGDTFERLKRECARIGATVIIPEY